MKNEYRIGDKVSYKGCDCEIHDIFKTIDKIIIKKGFGFEAEHIVVDKAVLDGNNP